MILLVVSPLSSDGGQQYLHRRVCAGETPGPHGHLPALGDTVPQPRTRPLPPALQSL